MLFDFFLDLLELPNGRRYVRTVQNIDLYMVIGTAGRLCLSRQTVQLLVLGKIKSEKVSGLGLMPVAMTPIESF